MTASGMTADCAVSKVRLPVSATSVYILLVQCIAVMNNTHLLDDTGFMHELFQNGVLCSQYNSLNCNLLTILNM